MRVVQAYSKQYSVIECLSTVFFDVKCGLELGCVLSPLLFNLYINDLFSDMKQLSSGINIE